MAIKLLDTDERIRVKDSELSVDDGDDETVYILRPIDTDTYRELEASKTERVLNKRTHQKEEKVDRVALLDACFDYALVGWEGVLFRGEPAPCTWEFKSKVDMRRRIQIVDRAGINEIVGKADAQADSFRGPADLRDVVAG